jgi:glycosyltransferase involved in cell wall biosynthesis
MPSLTALLHTYNDALRLGRCLETAYPCDEILVIDHGSIDDTVRVAQEFGAQVVQTSQTETVALREGKRLHPRGWFFCLDPKESFSEALVASLLEWKWNETAGDDSGYAILLREENEHGWIDNPVPETRLVPATWDRWNGRYPVNQHSSPTLEGKLLRFEFP